MIGEHRIPKDFFASIQRGVENGTLYILSNPIIFGPPVAAAIGSGYALRKAGFSNYVAVPVGVLALPVSVFVNLVFLLQSGLL